MLNINEAHSMSEYIELLSDSNKIYIDNGRLDDALRQARYLADDYKSLALLELRIEASGSYSLLATEYILEYLENIGVDVYKMYKTKSGRLSLDMKKVVEPLINQGIAVDLLTYYKMHRSYKTYASFLSTLAESKKIFNKTSDGRLILAYDTKVVEQDNLRAYYNNIAVVSIPKIFSNIVTVSDELHHLAWCDFPQADWRFAYNLFIRNKDNFDIMSKCKDAYEGLARIVEGESFDQNKFKESRKEYKVNALKVLYNSKDKHVVPTMIRDYYSTCEAYKRYMYDLSVLYHFKLPVPCESYFGYTQMIPEGRYPDAFISKGLNTPVQTFTSHVVMETVFGILNKFWSLGYTKDDINVYYVRHDEPLFVFKDSIIKDSWVFEDCSEIHIDGFTPIDLEFHFGNFYQEEDKLLSDKIKRNAQDKKFNITKYPLGEVKDYYPIPSVESVHVQFFENKKDDSTSGTVVIFHDYRRNEKYTFYSDKVSSEDALYDVINDLLGVLNNPKYLLVRNLSLDFIDRIGPDEETILKVIANYDSSVAVMLPNEE